MTNDCSENQRDPMAMNETRGRVAWIEITLICGFQNVNCINIC